MEAKADYKKAGDGMQQAKEYAQILGLLFAYSTNGKEIEEYNFITGKQKSIEAFPAPQELWQSVSQFKKINNPEIEKDFLAPFYREVGGKQPRYYQEIAINKAVEEVLKGNKRILITMATGTGKTFVAFQIIWKLWKSRRKKRILFLADRNILVDQGKTKHLARWAMLCGRFKVKLINQEKFILLFIRRFVVMTRDHLFIKNIQKIFLI